MFYRPNRILSKWLLILGICLLYYITARLGQLLALQPGFVSAIWPPSGISLACILLLGPSVWPGIFLGSTLGNFLLFPLTGDQLHIFINLVSAIIIGFGAALQALVGAYFIKKWIHSEDPFDTPENVVKFFLIGLGSCLINSNIGSLSLATNGVIPWNQYFQTWITWIVGDTAGIYVFTPFILSWAYHAHIKRSLWHYVETLIICILITVTIQVVLKLSLPLIFLIIPFLIWTAFRLSYVGISFVLLYTMTVFLMMNSLGKGHFTSYSLNYTLIIIEIMIGVFTFMTWIIASNLMARDKSAIQLQQYSQILENKLVTGTQALSSELEHIQLLRAQLLSQEHAAYLGEVSTGISHTIKDVTAWIKNLSQKNSQTLEKMCLTSPPPEIIDSIVELTSYTESIITLTKQIDKSLDRILIETPQGSIESTDINALCEEYVAYATKESITRSFWKNITVYRDYDPEVRTINIIPQDIGRVIYKLLDNANFALQEKKKLKGPGFDPAVWIQTKKFGDNISITIRDNGIGISEENLEKIFIPFFTTKQPHNGLGLGLSTCFEIIVGKHKGTMTVNSQEGEFTEVTVTLPRK